MAAYFLKQIPTKTVLNRVIFTSRKCASKETSYIIDSALRDIQVPDLTIPEYVFQNFSAWPNKTAMECGITGKKFTYEEIRKKSTNLGKGLRDRLKLKEGDVVAVLLPNVPEYPICILGALQAGLVVTTINPVYMPHEIKRQLKETNAKAVITLNNLWIIAQVAIKLIPADLPVLTIKTKNDERPPRGAIKFEEFINTEFVIKDASRRNMSDVAVIPFSSGTTDLPKGVDITHRNIVANLCQINVPYLRATKTTTDDYQDVVLNVIPWFHSYGLTAVLFHHLYNMSKIVSLPKCMPELYVSTLNKHKPSLLYAFSSTVTFLSNNRTIKQKHLESLRNVTSVKARFEPVTEERFLDKADKYIGMLQVYGLTETTACVFMASPIAKRICDLAGSIGETLPNTLVKIIPGESMGTKPCGELLIRGPQVMKGYHNNSEETNAAFADGWLRTGDIVYYNDNKMFYMRERLNEMIKVGKFKVAPSELEEIILSHPQIADAAVIGIPHTIHGEVPRAYVVVEPGAMVDPAELQEFVDEQVTDYKNIDGGIVIVDYIPKNVFGEVIKRFLRDQYEAETN